MKNSVNPRLSWTQADFLQFDCDMPESLVHDCLHTEGELLTREELMAWLKDSRATFMIIRESGEDRFEELYQEYLTDIKYLLTIGKISPEEAEEVTNKDLFTFFKEN